MFKDTPTGGEIPPTFSPEHTRQRYTKAERQRIRDAFAAKHGGVWYPRLFIEEAADPSHEAHDWFDWDDEHAGFMWRLEQARAFNKGLTRIKVITTTEDTVVVRHRVEMPSMLSPLSTRRNGGGYVAAEIDEFIRQAFRDLKGQAARYKAALVAVGAQDDMDAVLAKLEAGCK